MRNPIYPDLVGEMAKHGDTLKTIAKLLDLTVPSIWSRFAGKKDWTISEIETICDHYGKSYDDLFKRVN